MTLANLDSGKSSQRVIGLVGETFSAPASGPTPLCAQSADVLSGDQAAFTIEDPPQQGSFSTNVCRIPVGQVCEKLCERVYVPRTVGFS